MWIKSFPIHHTNPPPSNKPSAPTTSRKNREAIKRALDFYLCPQPSKARPPSTMFLIQPEIDTETLLAHACESLASANTLASDFADQLGRPQRNTALAIQQIIMLAELAVSRALDRVDPQV